MNADLIIILVAVALAAVFFTLALNAPRGPRRVRFMLEDQEIEIEAPSEKEMRAILGMVAEVKYPDPKVTHVQTRTASSHR